LAIRSRETSVVGGVSSRLYGGRFEEGFITAGAFAAARYAYNDIVRYDTAWGPGGEAVSKGSLDMPREFANNIGVANQIVDPNSMWGEGGIVSRVANYIPGVNAVSGLHDVYQIRLEQWGGEYARNSLNVPGMIPAAAMTYAGLLNNIQPYIDAAYRTKRND